MKNTLIIVGHPNFETSVSTKTIIDFLSATNETKSNLLEIRNLATLYPDCKFNIRAEQEALLWAEVIVLQFPFYWYSVPGLLKSWIDEVLLYGFAYGKTGDKLKGKHLLLSFTTGGPQETYAQGARNNFEIEQLLYPLIQTSNLIGTEWHSPVVSFSMVNIPGIDVDKTPIEQKAKLHAEKLYDKLISI
jgi:putative NADPH-quinone reductase